MIMIFLPNFQSSSSYIYVCVQIGMYIVIFGFDEELNFYRTRQQNTRIASKRDACERSLP